MGTTTLIIARTDSEVHTTTRSSKVLRSSSCPVRSCQLLMCGACLRVQAATFITNNIDPRDHPFIQARLRGGEGGERAGGRVLYKVSCRLSFFLFGVCTRCSFHAPAHVHVAHSTPLHMSCCPVHPPAFMMQGATSPVPTLGSCAARGESEADWEASHQSSVARAIRVVWLGLSE